MKHLVSAWRLFGMSTNTPCQGKTPSALAVSAMALLLTLSTHAATAAVNVDIRVSPGVANPGEQSIVEVTLVNDGITPELDLTADIVFPTGVNALFEPFVLGVNSTSCGGTGGGSNDDCTAGELIRWTVASLSAGQAVSWTFPTVVSSATADGTDINWVIDVTQSGEIAASDSDVLTVDDNSVATLAIDESHDPIAPGGTMNYTVHYGNTETSNLTNGALALTLPPGATFLSASGGGTVNGDQVEWPLGTLIPGAIGQQAVQVQVDPQAGFGTLLPVAAELTGTANFQPTERRAKETAYVGLAPTIAASVNVNQAPAAPGEQVIVSINVANTSLLPVSDVRVLLSVPTGTASIFEGFITGVNASSCGGTGAGSNDDCAANEFLFWDIASLAPGEGRDLWFPVAVNSAAASGSLIDWDVRITDGSGQESWEAVTLQVSTNAVATLAIDESHDPIAPGGTMNYTVRYGNTETSNLTNGTLALTLPTGTTFLSASGGGTINGDQVEWPLGTLIPGAIGQQTVQVQVDPQAGFGTLLPVAAELTGTANFQPTERRAKETAYVGFAPTIAASVNVNQAPAAPGEQVIVSINVANTSLLPVSDVRALLSVPTGTASIFEGFITGVNASSCGGTGAGTNDDCAANEFLFWDIASLAPGEGRDLWFPVAVNSAAASGSLIDWDIRVTDGSGQESWEAVTLQVSTNAVATLAIDESHDPIAPGGTMNYTVHYGNTETSNLTNGALALTLPPGTTFLSASGGGAVNGDQVEWALSTLIPGAIGQQTVQVQVDPQAGFGTLLPVAAELTGTANFQPTERRAKETAYVGFAPTIAASVNLNQAPAAPGEQVIVSINVANTSLLPVSDVRALLSVPTGMASIFEGFITGVNAVSCGGTGAGSNDDCAANEFLFWDIASLAPGEGRDLWFPVAVNSAAASGSLVDWDIRVTDGSGQESWEAVTLQVSTNAVAALAIDESHDPIAPGGTMNYTVRYGNTETSNLTNGALALTLPQGTTFLSASGGGAVNGDQVEWPLDTLIPGAIGQQTVQVQVDPQAGFGTLLRVAAELTGTANFQATERRARETAYVGLGGDLDASISVNPLPALPGEQTLLSIEVTNTSNLPLTEAQVLLNYPTGVDVVFEGSVTGGVDASSCGGTGSGSNDDCTANEFLFWSIDTVAPGETLVLSLPPTVSSSTDFGDLVQWSVRFLDGNGTQSWREVSLPVGVDVSADTDGDGAGDAFDNCTLVGNSSQLDTDGDGIGNVCDQDISAPNDCQIDFLDLTPLKDAFFASPDAVNWNADADFNDDKVINFLDLTIMKEAFFQPPGPSAGGCN